MCFKQNKSVYTFNGKYLELIHQFIYLDSNISSTESDVNVRVGKTQTTIASYRSYRNFYFSYEIKLGFFYTVVPPEILQRCTTWTLTKRLEKKLNGSCTIIFVCCSQEILKAAPHKKAAARAIIRHLTTRHTGYYSKSRDEPRSDVLLDGTLTGPSSPGQSGPGNNVNEVVLYPPQISSSDVISCHTQNIPFCGRVSNFHQRNSQ